MQMFINLFLLFICVYSVSWGYLGAVFGESLERDITETSILQDQLGKKRTEETEIRGITDDGKSQDVHTESKQKNRERSHSVERWSLIDEVLQKFKDHSHDNKQVCDLSFIYVHQ